MGQESSDRCRKFGDQRSLSGDSSPRLIAKAGLSLFALLEGTPLLSDAAPAVASFGRIRTEVSHIWTVSVVGTTYSAYVLWALSYAFGMWAVAQVSWRSAAENE
jgi:hypothetical protein